MGRGRRPGSVASDLPLANVGEFDGACPRIGAVPSLESSQVLFQRCVVEEGYLEPHDVAVGVLVEQIALPEKRLCSTLIQDDPAVVVLWQLECESVEDVRLDRSLERVGVWPLHADDQMNACRSRLLSEATNRSLE